MTRSLETYDLGDGNKIGVESEKGESARRKILDKIFYLVKVKNTNVLRPPPTLFWGGVWFIS